MGNFFSTEKFIIKKTLSNTYNGKICECIYNQKKCIAKIMNIKHGNCEKNIIDKIGQHPNIIKKIDDFEQDNKLVMIFERADCDLFEWFNKKIKLNHVITLTTKLTYLKMIAKGLAHIHETGSHRDIKLENILILNKVIKICDFGFATTKTFKQTTCGTPLYSPPEVGLGKSYNCKKVDIYNFGILIYILIDESYPILGTTPTIKKYQNTSLKQLVDSMLQNKPTDRPTIKEVLISLNNIHNISKKN